MLIADTPAGTARAEVAAVALDKAPAPESAAIIAPSANATTNRSLDIEA